MKLMIESVVVIDGIGECKHHHVQDFADDSNVFGRVFEYHEYMHRAFPDCDFKAVKVTEV